MGIGENSKIMKFFPVLSFVCCDNKEAVSLASIKAGNTPKPCRFCLCERSQLHNFDDLDQWPPRDTSEAATAIVEQNKTYCKDNSVHYDVEVN